MSFQCHSFVFDSRSTYCLNVIITNVRARHRGQHPVLLEVQSDKTGYGNQDDSEENGLGISRIRRL